MEILLVLGAFIVYSYVTQKLDLFKIGALFFLTGGFMFGWVFFHCIALVLLILSVMKNVDHLGKEMIIMIPTALAIVSTF